MLAYMAGLEWLILLVAVAIFWIWVLVDCVRNESDDGNKRVVWAVVIAVTHGIGALIYLIVRRPRRKAVLGR